MKLSCKIVVLLLFLFSTVKAQHDHSSHSHENASYNKIKLPHGGEITDVGKYQIEIVFDVYTANEKLNIWILKPNFKLLNPKEFTGKVKLQYADGNEIEKILIIGTDKLFCNVEDVTKSFTAIINVNSNGKEYHTTYNYNGLGKK